MFFISNILLYANALIGNAKSCTCGQIAPCPSTCWRLTVWQATLHTRTWGFWYATAWTWDSNVLLQQRGQQLLHFQQLKEAFLPIYSALVKHIWGAGPRCGLPSTRGRQERIQQRATKTIKRLKHLSNGERLRELKLFILRNGGNAQGVWSMCIMGLIRQCKKAEFRLLSVVLSGRTRGSGHKLKHGREEPLFHCKGNWALAQASQKSCGVSILGDSKAIWTCLSRWLPEMTSSLSHFVIL